jgi:hypothetical protein
LKRWRNHFTLSAARCAALERECMAIVAELAAEEPMTEKLTDHERRCRELDRAFARYGMGRSEAEYFQSLLSCGEWLIGLWRASGPLALREGLEDLIGTKWEILARIARLKNERHAARAGWRG